MVIEHVSPASAKAKYPWPPPRSPKKTPCNKPSMLWSGWSNTEWPYEVLFLYGLVLLHPLSYSDQSIVTTSQQQVLWSITNCNMRLMKHSNVCCRLVANWFTVLSTRLVPVGQDIQYSNCGEGHAVPTLCCKSRSVWEEYYQAVDKGHNYRYVLCWRY